MEIKQNLVPESKYSLKCPYTMTPIGLCVHNTANDASAKNEISYMVGNTNQTSFHFAVDDIEVWQGLPLNRNGWHAGDGNGDGNRKHIAIEICHSKSGGSKFVKAEENAIEFIAQLLKERGWGTDKVKKHQDFSGKYCPHRTLDLGWDRFINLIKNKLGETMDMFKGLDLTNKDSMKVAVNVWDEVVNQKLWVKASEVEKIKSESQQLKGEIDSLKLQLKNKDNLMLEKLAIKEAECQKKLNDQKSELFSMHEKEILKQEDKIHELEQTIVDLKKAKPTTTEAKIENHTHPDWFTTLRWIKK